MNRTILLVIILVIGLTQLISAEHPGDDYIKKVFCSIQDYALDKVANGDRIFPCRVHGEKD